MATTETSLARPADLEIRITTPWGQGGRSLDFVLHSPSGVVEFFQKTIHGKPIRSPEEFQKKLFGQLNHLQKGLDIEGGRLQQVEIPGELTTLGHDLYQELFPRELRRIYRDIRDRVETLVITSDEPWIPWEILRPFEFPDDDFFCMRFQMGRWLAGDTALAPSIRVSRWLGLHPGNDPSLTKAGSEIGLLEQLFKGIAGVEPLLPAMNQPREVLQCLETEPLDLLHFVGHGKHGEGRPGESKIRLGDWGLRVRQLSPLAEQNLRAHRPLVFFNTCHGGRLDHSLTRLDGWAARWVQRHGCSAFLAPLWTVRDPVALRFAQAFYERLLQGSTLGEAVLFARHILRKEVPHEPAWLAYSFYGHPNARVVLGEQRTTRTPPPGPVEWMTPPQIPEMEEETSSARSRFPSRLHLLSGILILLMLASGLYLFFSFRLSEEEPDPVEVASPPLVDPADSRSTLSPAQPKDSEPDPELQEDAKPDIPLLPIVTGKVGLLVGDAETLRPAPRVGRAIQAVLMQEARIRLYMPETTSNEIRRFLATEPSLFSGNSRAPWGVEYLLVATVEQKKLNSAAHLESVALTIGATLIDAGTGEIVLYTQEPHTGNQPSIDAALVQAATRCLRDVTEFFQGKEDEVS